MAVLSKDPGGLARNPTVLMRTRAGASGLRPPARSWPASDLSWPHLDIIFGKVIG